jgi:hypothetical protein
MQMLRLTALSSALLALTVAAQPVKATDYTVDGHPIYPTYTPPPSQPYTPPPLAPPPPLGTSNDGTRYSSSPNPGGGYTAQPSGGGTSVKCSDLFDCNRKVTTDPVWQPKPPPQNQPSSQPNPGLPPSVPTPVANPYYHLPGTNPGHGSCFGYVGNVLQYCLAQRAQQQQKVTSNKWFYWHPVTHSANPSTRPDGRNVAFGRLPQTRNVAFGRLPQTRNVAFGRLPQTGLARQRIPSNAFITRRR